MVSALERRELDRLQWEVKHKVGDGSEYLALLRKLKIRRSEEVAVMGMKLLNDVKARERMGNELWALYEQVAIANMDCQAFTAAKDCVGALMAKFPDSTRVGKLEGMWLEAQGMWQEAEKVYASILEDHPTDAQILKRKIAMAKAQGNLVGTVEEMNKYLELFMADHECWRELGDVYISLQMYKQAAFCYEELILAQPMNPLFHVTYAEILYTIGGLDNLKTAKKYYASAIELTGGKNMRALYGMILCSGAISQLTKGKNKEENSNELANLASGVVERTYESSVYSQASLIARYLQKLKMAN